MATEDATGALRVEVCYASDAGHFLRALELPAGATVEQAIAASGVLDTVPGLDLAALRVGIYAKKKTLDTPLRDHDRVELYRPLIADPKNARRRRKTA